MPATILDMICEHISEQNKVLSFINVNTLVCMRGDRKYTYILVYMYIYIDVQMNYEKKKQERWVGMGKRVTLSNKVFRKAPLMR